MELHIEATLRNWEVILARPLRRQRVLDVGALDLNGNNKILFEGCAYTGIDIGEGPNVDVVSVAHEYPAPSESFDVIISTECLEHDRHYPETLRNIVRMHGASVKRS